MQREFFGYLLKQGVYNRMGALVLTGNSILNIDNLELLDNHKILLETNDVEKIETEKMISSAAAELEDIFSGIRSSQSIPVNEVHDRILPSISTVAETPDLSSILSDLQAKDEYTYRHNVGVAIFSNMIGKWLHMDNKDLAELTMAATFHDIGKIDISDDILNKPGRFTDEEYEQMKRHPLIGYEIIRKNPALSERVALVAVQHHEREDGTGYPYGIKGGDMDYFSKIVAVADVFHALSTRRVYRPAMQFYKMMLIMKEESYGKLNSEICNLFIQRMMELTIGNSVRMSNGQTGKVVLIHPATPDLPLVEVGQTFIDLSQNPDVHIEALSGAR